MNTNLGGPLNLIELSDKYKVEKFVLVSTDKAVNPVNVMGATKRAAEKLIQSYIEIVEPTDLWTAEAYLRYIVQNCSFIVNNKITSTDDFSDFNFDGFQWDGDVFIKEN